MTSSNDIRAAFVDYFAGHDHTPVASASLVPRNDPTLLFTNAGMVQFKNVFTGAETRPYRRAVTAQKCVRAGGKHNDLENVGYTARHHTFFEMLGNFSFGDYFKERAVELAWTLVTREFALAKERLWITTYPEDEEAKTLWRKISGLPASRIIGHHENLWAMGPTGPCGYCAEIFYDQGEALPGGPPGSADEDGDRYLEFWNLVFMQFDQVDAETRVDLPKPSIDTGMGLERIAAILQGVHSSYDTDGLRTLIEASADAADTAADGNQAVSHRIIADHLRACSFLLADGVMPSNEGRGYVLRRIMRRAMRHAQLLGCRAPLLHRLVPALMQTMGQAYGELGRAEALITETFKLEEERFKQTLERGLRLLTDATDRLGGGQALPGDVAFKLYDTYGFPLDLTEDILRGEGRGVDVAGFAAAMAEQRAAARKAWVGSGEVATEEIWFDLHEEVGASEFLGYDTTSAEAAVQALIIDGRRVATATTGQDVAVVVNQTPFYGEAGGQLGDTGSLWTTGGAQIAVRDTQKKVGDLHVHLGALTKGTLAVGNVVQLHVDAGRRDLLRANHSATHLLHRALRQRLGDHVTQKGSLVAPDRLRFDIAQPRAISAAELRDVEALVNDQIRANTGVTTRLMAPDAAIDAGALALFGEKYGDEVRVVSMGAGEPLSLAADEPYSTELCGGTHVRRTGDIGLFKIVAEGAVAAGVRRIEALTGAAALAHLAEQEQLLQSAAEAVKAAPADLPARVTALLDERRRLERELAETRRRLALGGDNGAEAAPKQVAGVSYAARQLDGIPAKELRAMADAMKQQLGSGIVAVASVDDGKASLVVGVTDDLTPRFSAVDLVRVGVAALGGKGGGGRPDLAQGGGPEAARAAGALTAIEDALGGSA